LNSEPKDLDELENWANEYLKAYNNDKDDWKCNLTTRLERLAKILHIHEIFKQIPQGYDRLILIPHRFLHLLPLHALPVAGKSYLLDHFSRGVRYAPSCQLLQLAQTRQRPDFTHLFAVQNPTKDLDYAELEVEIIQRLFNSPPDVLKNADATRAAINGRHLHTVHCVHFSCHGYFNLTNPRKSTLILADAQLNSPPSELDPEYHLRWREGKVLDLDKCLTLDTILSLKLEQCRLVTLSACETGLIDSQNTSDEYIGLTSGFLVAGSPAIVSSLWTVDELATAFLLIKFYQNTQTQPVAEALKEAQAWLRSATQAQLTACLKQMGLDANRVEEIEIELELYDDEQPFSKPQYWAAFCTIGQ
jgi:CHAT domain-containing protein